MPIRPFHEVSSPTPFDKIITPRSVSHSESKRMKIRRTLTEAEADEGIEEHKHSGYAVKTTAAFMTANSIFDDEFNRLVKLGMSKSFQLIRKDRRGVAITKASK